MYKFYYGEDTYSLQQKISQIEVQFIAKEGGDFNVVKLDGGKLTLDLFMTNILMMPFLGERRLLIIKNFLIDNSDKDLKKKIVDNLVKIPDHTIVLFVEMGLPDKRESIFKALDKKPTSTYFPPFDDLKLRSWIKEEFEKEGLKIANSDLFKIALLVGSDLWQLKNEVSKITAWVKSQNRDNVISDDITKFIEQTESFKIFDLTDSIAKKDSKKAMTIMNSFFEDGEDEFMIFNMIVFQFRNMLIISDLSKSMKGDEIAKKAGIHPFVVKKTLESIKKFSTKELVEIYDKLANIDYQTKTGQTDLKISLSLLVVELCKIC